MKAIIITFRRHFDEDCINPLKSLDTFSSDNIQSSDCIAKGSPDIILSSSSIDINEKVVDKLELNLSIQKCMKAAKMDQSLSMSLLFHQYSKRMNIIDRVSDEMGSCHVQVLRSIGKWSAGTKTECSIMNCYIETIKSAKKLIYIENQFFIGISNNESSDVRMNCIPYAIVDRILKAHRANEKFRVIIIIPMHPNGDFSSAMKSKLVLHYEHMTISKG